MIYSRRLSRTEGERHYIYVTTKARNMFPPRDQKFKLRIGGIEYEVELDSQYRIWLSHKVDMHEGLSIEISSNDDVYTLTTK